MADTRGRRPPGRPPLDPTRVPSASVHLTLSAADYDAADRLARRTRETLQDTIRRSLRRLLRDERAP